MSKSNFIHHKRGAYPSASCISMIDYFEANSDLQKDGGFGLKGKLDNKEITIDTYAFGLNTPLCDVVEEYKKIYPAVDTGLRPWRVYRWAQLMRYMPGAYYSTEHCENDGSVNDTDRCHTRVFGWMIFLNTIQDGGGTMFTQQNCLIIRPREGDLYIWPAHWTHMHKGVKAPTETKYIITGWCNFL